VNAPKTEDSQYEEANSLFQTHSIQLSDLRDPLTQLIKILLQFSVTCTKFSANVNTWLTDGDQLTHSTLGPACDDLARYMAAFESQTGPFFQTRIIPNFFDPLVVYEKSVSEVAKLRSNRSKACSDFDRDRELLRLAETAKKPKQSDIDKARQKCDDSHARYDAANVAFIEAVQQLDVARVKSLGDPFKHLTAVFVQFMRQITPEPGNQPRKRALEAQAANAPFVVTVAGLPPIIVPPPPAVKPAPPTDESPFH
jgi:hypothetical protein